jgi:uridine kinase
MDVKGHNEKQPFLLGITGGSCSGKTGLAADLANELKTQQAILLPLDSYYHDLSSIPEEERSKINFDIPEALDFDLYSRHLRQLLDGSPVSIPSYNFTTHTRLPESGCSTVAIGTGGTSRPVIISEGLHIFHLPYIRELFDLKIFIDAPAEICLERRIERDVRERGRSREDIVHQFEETVMPMYERYVLPAREYADIIIDGTATIEKSIEMIISLIMP